MTIMPEGNKGVFLNWIRNAVARLKAWLLAGLLDARHRTARKPLVCDKKYGVAP
jgi:hypothetical protein